MQRPECRSECGVFAASTAIGRSILNFTFGIVFLGWQAGVVALAGENPGAVEFHKTVRPLLENYCFDCHADGANKGQVAFDEFKSDQDVLGNRELWSKALKNLRAGLMPPAKKSQPTAEEKQ